MSARRALVGAAACILSLGGPAYGDGQLWIEPGLGFEPAKRVEVDVSSEVRFDQDISRFAALLPEASVSYRIEKWLRVGGGYRFEYERDKDGVLVVRHRIAGDVRLRYEHEPIRVDYRLRLAEQIRPSSNDQLRTVLRNRVGVSYRAWKPWIPGAEVEVFHALGDLDQLDYDRFRLTVGVTHSRGAHDVQAFFRIEAHADPQEETALILGLEYHYQL